MPINAVCKCGTDLVTDANKVEAIKWAVKGCEDCKEDVKFNVTKSDRVRPGRGN